MSVILMYHAIHDGDPHPAIAPEDRPYAISRDAFTRQLDRIEAQQRATGQPVRLTFDDGHVSNHDIALPLLLERGLRATFFITTAFVGVREHFCSGAQLRRMAQAGMTIGGHGHTHAFLDDLSPQAAREEFERCQAALSTLLGQAPSALSFPGGRHDASSVRLAREAGFEELHGSLLAVVDPSAAANAVLPRVAIRSNTDLATFERMILPDRRWYAARQRAQRAKHLMRRAIGNRLYHALYTTVSAR